MISAAIKRAIVTVVTAMVGSSSIAAAAEQPKAAQPAAPVTNTAGASAPMSTNIWDGVYTNAQAKRGDALYAKNCAGCHLPDMSGKEPAPELAGDIFMGTWSGRSVGQLFSQISTTMPAGKPGTLAKADYVDLVALLLQANNFRPGKSDLQADQAALDKIQIRPRK